MKKEWKQRVQQSGRKIAGIGVALSMAGMANAHWPQQAKGGVETATTNAEGHFYCNVKALTAAERARHKELTEKLMTATHETVETAKGYEFQYSPEKISVGELAEWIMAESKCCPFFDFHIDLEEQGKLICLRLTGSEGIKAFIRSEFKVAPDGGR